MVPAMHRSLVVFLGCQAFTACSGSRAPTGEPATGRVGVAGEALPAPDPREVTLAGAVVELLERHHVVGLVVDDALSRVAFDAYIEALDGGKAFLRRGDVDGLRRHADKIDDQLRSGRLELAHEGAAVFQARLAVVATMVAELLAAPFDTSDEEFVELDPEKLELAVTDDELRTRWRQRLEADVLDRVAGMEERLAAKARQAAGKADPAAAAVDAGVAPMADDIPATREAREAKARGELAESYKARFARLAHPGSLEAASDLINAVTSVFDPHTRFLPPADEANFDIELTGSLEGIGAVLSEDDHYIRVVEIVPGGASYRQGKLQAGDHILAVAQQGADPIDVADMRIDDVVAMVRGKAGTVVTLTVQKASGEVLDLAITRDVVVIEDSYARGAEIGRDKDKRSWGYIHLPGFYGGEGAKRSAATDVRRLLAALERRKVAGVVIDLRSNGGGLLGAAVDMAGLFVDQGPIVQTKERTGAPEVLSDTDAGTTYDGPVIVMVDRFTASASEIVAGALQDYRRAVIVGTSATHGKGSVQVLADLDKATRSKEPLGVLKLTIEMYYRVSGASTQWKGVVPDIMLPDPSGFFDGGERELKHSIPYGEVAEQRYDALSPAWQLDALAASSQARVAKDPVFARVVQRVALLRKRRDETQLPLALPTWTKLRAERRDELTAATPDLAAGPVRFKVTALDADGAVATAAKDGKLDPRVVAWSTGLAHDPWLDETLRILADLAGPTPAASAR